jgi:hypothetical protein
MMWTRVYSLRRRAIMGLMLSLLVAAPAAAQTAGVQAGVSLDPDQFYFGGHVQTAPLVDRLRFRPSAEIGLGNDVTLVGLNLEFAYVFPSQQAWSLYAGAGPALNIIHIDRDTQAQGGFNILIGAAHRDGLFVEFKVGALDSPNVKFGIGYVFR